jgi:uncharacterized protein (TIGR02996 family)
MVRRPDRSGADMSDLTTLLALVAADPGDETLRLVAADAAQEAGRDDEADLLRRLDARLVVEGGRVREAGIRVAELLDEIEAAVADELLADAQTGATDRAYVRVSADGRHVYGGREPAAFLPGPVFGDPESLPLTVWETAGLRRPVGPTGGLQWVPDTGGRWIASPDGEQFRAVRDLDADDVEVLESGGWFRFDLGDWVDPPDLSAERRRWEELIREWAAERDLRVED